MVVTCDIVFEQNPNAIYFAGQVILGKVTLTTDKIKQVEALNLKINGCAKTRWKTYGGRKLSSPRSRKSTIYCGQVDYIDTVTCLLAPNATDQAVSIEPGIHTFSFACHVPANCPSSLEATNGSIRYVVKLSLVRPWKFDQTFTKAFTILAIKDLNYDSPLLKLPGNSTISQKLCCGPCETDPLQMNCQLPQTGFVPGQHIPASILITNNTSARIYEICVRLVMVVNLFSTRPHKCSKIETKTISQLKGEPVLRNITKKFDYLLPVPATPPSCTNLCNIIQIYYRVEVEAKIEGIFYRNKCLTVPVTIGNVPFYSTEMVVQQQPSSNKINYENDVKIINKNCAVTKVEDKIESVSNDENREPWSALGNFAAPIYEKAPHMPQVKLAEDDDHDYGEKMFAPKYPVFNIRSSTSLQQINNDDIDGHITASTATDPNKTTWL